MIYSDLKKLLKIKLTFHLKNTIKSFFFVAKISSNTHLTMQKKTLNYTYLILLFLGVISCDQLTTASLDEVVARAGTSYLYKSDLTSEFPKNLSYEDSIVWVDNYINNWAKKQLLYNKAEFNLKQEIQEDLNKLVEDYKFDLWARTYKETVVKSLIDTLITEKEVRQFYASNKTNFKLNEDMLQLRYIVLPIINTDLKEISDRFRRFDESDYAYLDSLNYHFNRFDLTDSLWMTKREFQKLLPQEKKANYEEYLKKSQFFYAEDALEVYLFFVNDVRRRNEIAPYHTIKNTIKRIVFNRKKIDFIKQFDQEILKDAIQTKKFEVYQ